MTRTNGPNARISPSGRAAALHQGGRLVEAIGIYDQLLAANPDDVDALCSRANVLADLGRLEDALASYDRAIARDPKHADALDFRAITLASLGRMEDALESLNRSLEARPDNPNALGNRGNILKNIGRSDEALCDFERALTLRPDFAAAHSNRGNVLIEQKKFDEALASYDRALALQPLSSDIHHNRGKALEGLHRYEDALASYNRAVGHNPTNADALYSRGLLLSVLERPEQAIASYDRVIKLKPSHIDAHLRKAEALVNIGRVPDALAALKQAGERGRGIILNNIGMAFAQLERVEEAVDCLQRAISEVPDNPLAYGNMASLLKTLGRDEQAFEYQSKACERDPYLAYGVGMRFFLALSHCRWDDYDAQAAAIAASVRADERSIAPFPLLAFSGDAQLQRQCSEAFGRATCPPTPARALAGKYPRRDRIRIGYFSADFHLHATMRLLAETLETHDRSRFETFGLSFGPDTGDVWRKRAGASFDHFIDVRAMTDRQAANLARHHEIDIAIDLKGYTRSCRTGIFAERAAPIQVNYLGYPGTMGIPFIDYLVADRVLIPSTHRHFYSEKIVFLPGTYQANSSWDKGGAPDLKRADVGLPENGFVYCCFNQWYKITPGMFGIWMRILDRVDRSVLWLWVEDGAARSNLKREAHIRGVDPARLIFASHVPFDMHLSRLRLADLFLDTLPCNAHTTASDALRAGLPLLTCTGQAFASRVAASLSAAAGVSDLISENLENYEARAVELGLNPSMMAQVRKNVEARVAGSSLFDARNFARKLEAGYFQMYDRYQEDLPPDDIFLS